MSRTGGTGGPGDVQRVERCALGFGDGGRHGETGAHAASSGLAQQREARGDDGAEHVRRIGTDHLAAGRGGDEPPAQADQGGAVAVRVHLRGEDDGAFGVEREPVGGAAVRARGGRGARVDPDQPERFQLGGHGARGGARDP
ncbi:predicted protein [Streptomyces sp. SPB78]|nr:predicted protein [Streptomyces sp. SPB78]